MVDFAKYLAQKKAQRAAALNAMGEAPMQSPDPDDERPHEPGEHWTDDTYEPYVPPEPDAVTGFEEPVDASAYAGIADVDRQIDVAIPPILLNSLSFLCGPAGCGKTTIARSWVRQYPGTILAATTGIAAVNLGEGTTINALLKYFDTQSLQESHVGGHLTAVMGKLYRSGVRRILLDEVSMLDALQLTVLVRSLQQLAGKGYTLDVTLTDEVQAQMLHEGLDPDAQLPIGLTLIGDFAQLPPIKAAYAFESPEWGEFEAHTYRMDGSYRQADPEFRGALMAARKGDWQTVCAYFGPRLHQTADPNFDGTTILGTNDAVDRYNALRMDAFKGAATVYAAKRWGTQRGDWKGIPDALALKPGALVMILANLRQKGTEDGMPGKLIYANGDLGHVEACESGRVHVRLKRTKQVVEVGYLQRTNTIPLEPGRRKELAAQGKAELATDRMEIIGTVDYIPVRVAYATTCHKSQGLSLDNVQVNTREGFFKQAGLLYVALSRARTSAGLRVVGSVDGLKTRCTVHKKVAQWV